MEDTLDRVVVVVENGAEGPARPEDRVEIETVRESEDEVYRSDSEEEQASVQGNNVSDAEVLELPGEVVEPSAARPGDHRGVARARVIHHYHHQHCPTVGCVAAAAARANESSSVAGAVGGSAQRDVDRERIGRRLENLEAQHRRVSYAVEGYAAQLRRERQRRERSRARFSDWEPIEVARDSRDSARGYRVRSPSSRRRSLLEGARRHSPIQQFHPRRSPLRGASSPGRRSPSPVRRVSPGSCSRRVVRRSPSPVGRSTPRVVRAPSPCWRSLFSPTRSPSALSAYIANTHDRCSSRVRRNTRDYFISQVVRIRETHPDWNADRGWTCLVQRALAAGYYEASTQVSRAWLIAFSQPTHAHFRSIWGRDIEQLRNALPRQTPSFDFDRDELVRF